MVAKAKDPKILTIGGYKIARGERKRISLKVAALYDYTELTIPVEVIRGKDAGPVMFVSAAIHGDEINGVEAIKRLLRRPSLKKIKGTLIAIPVVNVFGFNSKSRYLPDRRDLNRSFPGKKNGSLASNMAHIFMKEIVSKCTHGIDLHTGAIHRTNLPQIRTRLDNPETKRLAQAFGAPVIIDSSLRDGSLREAAAGRKVNILLFEGGEALRFEEPVIKSALSGCIAVMQQIGMLPILKKKEIKRAYVANRSEWVRSPHSGAFHSLIKMGELVSKGDILARISDPFGCEFYDVISEVDGIVIGGSVIPLVNKGDAMFHIATFNNSQKVRKHITEHWDT